MAYNYSLLRGDNNPWLRPDPRQQMPAPTVYGPVNQGQPSPWDNLQGTASPEPTAQDEINQNLKLAMMAPHSGQKESASQTDTESSKYTRASHQGLYETPEELYAHSQAAALVPEIAAQKESQDQNRFLFQQEMMRPRVADLANPLSIAAHDMDARNAIIPPQQIGMSEKEVREWSKQQQDDQRDLARTIIQANNAQKSGFLNEQVMQALGLKTALSNEAKDPAMNTRNAQPVDVKNWNNWLTTVDRDPIISKTPNMLEKLKHAESMLQSNSPVSASNFRYALLQGLGVPRITNYELAGEQGSKALWDKLDQMVETTTEGNLTPKNRNDYLALINGIMASHSQTYDQHRQFHINRGVSGPWKINPQDAALGVNSLESPGQGLGHVPTNRPRAKSEEPAAPKVDIKALFEKALKEEGSH